MYLNKLLFAYVTNHPKIKCLKTQDSVSWKLGQKIVEKLGFVVCVLLSMALHLYWDAG